MTGPFAAVRLVAIGTNEKCRDGRYLIATGGDADIRSERCDFAL